MLLSKKGSDAPFKINDPIQYTQYWSELRFRALRTFAIIMCVFSLVAFAYKEIWTFFLAHLKQNCSVLKIVSRSVLGPTTVTINLSLGLSLLAGFFWLVTELWFFVRPALNIKEKKIIKRGLFFFLSTVLFFQYMAFFKALPYTLNWFVSINSEIVEPSVDLSELISFVLLIQKITFLVTLWPFALFWLIAQGWISEGHLQNARKYVYVLSFFIGMILTPPDVFSQCAVAFLLILFYEFVLLSRKIWILLNFKASS